MPTSAATTRPFKVLVLAGTTESRRLAERLTGDTRFSLLLSFAGRTRLPAMPVRHRVGGFGGSAGLGEFLKREGFDALVDATHPFAARMSANAVTAAELARVPLIRLERDEWPREPGDRWHDVATMTEAALALGATPRRAFLSVGRQELAAFETAPQHEYVIRAIEPFEVRLPRARVILERGPFELAAERALLEREAIEVVVSKHSGTAATYPKIAAARALRLPVILVRRPALPQAPLARDLDDILRWLHALHGAAPLADLP